MGLKKTAILLCAAAIGSIVLLLCAGCNSRDANTDTGQQILSFRDIPDITADEIAAIESLINERRSFSFGNLSSATAYVLPDGSYAGFAVDLCNLLSELFGIPFVLEILDWQELHDRIGAFDLDFTGSMNVPAYIHNGYYHSSPIAGNRLSVFTSNEPSGVQVHSEYDLRSLRIGFFKGSYTEEITRNAFKHVDFESVDINTADEMAQKLSTGEIEVFIMDTADIFDFTEYEHVTRVKDFPSIYVPNVITTKNPQMQPVISAITKYLMAGGINEVDRIYAIGEHGYASQAIWKTLNEEERSYITGLNATGARIPIGATSGRYPVAFFDKNKKQFDGIAIDVLSEISALTGLEFYYNCDETTSWVELEGMLKTGEIAILSQLIPNEPRKEYAIWPDAPYFTARYSLLSNINYPFLNINQVPYATVGMAGGTAEENKYNEWFPEDKNYVTFRSTDDGLTALENGEIDLFFSLDYTMLYESNYRENPNQRINILFDEPIENVSFGINKNEEVLCSIINKAQSMINTDRIVRSWTSRIFDTSAKEAEERARMLSIFSACLLTLLGVVSLLFVRGHKLKGNVEKQAKAALDASRNLEILLEMAPVGIIITRRGDGSILYANRAGLNIFECDSFEEDVEGHVSFDYLPEFQPDGRKSRDVIRDFWIQDRGVSEIQFMKKNGEAFQGRIAYCGIVYYNTTASLNVVEDMTIERKSQQRLKEIANKEQEANQLKSHFLATMSHEIRTPMNAIIGMTDIALRETEPDIKNNHILTIKQAGDNLLSLISDILDFSKIEAGKMDIVTTGYSLDSLINDVVSIIRMKVIDSPVQFTVKADSNIPRMLYGDVTRVRQAVLNILNNAVKYTERGVVSLDVCMEPLEEEPASGTSAHKPDGKTVKLIFRVTDSGIGIKKEDIDKLFVTFTQLDADKNRAVEGVGLGLAITHKIVDAMEGRIDVESEYGAGSIFTITIPQVYYMREPLAGVNDPGSKSILLYKHNEIYNESVVYALDNLGVSYTVVYDDDDLQEKLESGAFDYLFISFSLYSRNLRTVLKYDAKVEISVFAEFGEASPSRRVNVLTMPVYCTAIADVLNGISDITQYAGNETAIKFTASGVRALVVDDIFTNLKVAEGLLESYKIRVDVCNGGAASVEAVQKAGTDGTERYDLIFMDHKMPDVDGVEATRRIRALGETDEYYRDVPIIALTANAVSGAMEMLMENGFSDYLTKPIDTNRLNTVLERWIPKEKKDN